MVHLHIKRIIIKGFKSYREQIVFEDFGPNTNIVVGSNGSGKSNFFDAIRFVLNDDKYSNLRPQDIQALLYEGPGETDVVSAFVEVHFDNSEHRLPQDGEQVVLRRTIGLKKDEYFLDQRHLLKQDVASLLESAGFSRSNPYYIVQQGKVNALTLMKDSERLDLLKEVAGTRVYDDRKNQSLVIMAETEKKRAQIVEVLSYIERRLEELRDEQDELSRYQELDRQRRCMEYSLLDHDFREAADKLESLEETRQQESAAAHALHEQLASAQAEQHLCERERKWLHSERTQLAQQQSVLHDHLSDVSDRKQRLEGNLMLLRSRIERVRSEKERIRVESEQLEKLLSTAKAKLASILPAFETAADRERTMVDSVRQIEQRRSALVCKQGRSELFASKEEREQWLSKQLADIGESMKVNQAQLQTLEADEEKLRQGQRTAAASVAKNEANIVDMRARLHDANEQLNVFRAQRDQLANLRREQWRVDANAEAELGSWQEELRKAERRLQFSMPRLVSTGLEAVRRVTQTRQLKGVYGPLIELFSCDKKVMTAVEVSAGNSLFNVVVDTDATASVLLAALNEERVGRVTFMPLNRLRPHAPPSVPEGADVRPLIKELRFAPIFEAAMMQLFGKTLLCKNLQLAGPIARSHGFNCVTLDGDQVNKKGAITGGYYDVRRSRMDAVYSARTWRQKVAEVQESSEKQRSKLVELDQSISGVLGEMQKKEAFIMRARTDLEQETMELRLMKREEASFSSLLRQRAEDKAQLRITEQDLRRSSEELLTELRTESRLTPEEEQELVRLNEQFVTSNRQAVELTNARAELEEEKMLAEMQISNNLALRQLLLQEELSELEGNDDQLAAQEMSTQVGLLQQDHDSLETAQAEIESKLKAKDARIERLAKLITEHKRGNEEMRTKLQEVSLSMERLMNRRRVHQEKRESCIKKIRDLGALPADALTKKYVGMKQDLLYKEMIAVNAELKKYSHVNKKAADQYASFVDQRATLAARVKDLTNEAQGIKEMIEILEQRKHQAIERTYKGVAKSFSDVFSELVPAGKASLLMITGPAAASQASSSASSQASPASSQLVYSAISFQVSFTGTGPVSSMEQLSGGQKALVALALIFAIQRSDPAPFYLFDEIDSALDPQYRRSVAQMIRRQSQNAQFIVTTFKPELVEHGHQFYAIKYRNKVSSIEITDKETAMAIIQEESKP